MSPLHVPAVVACENFGAYAAAVLLVFLSFFFSLCCLRFVLENSCCQILWIHNIVYDQFQMRLALDVSRGGGGGGGI